MMTKAMEKSEMMDSNGECPPAAHGANNEENTSGPSSPAPSVSCETCSQLSQLELDAFAAVREVSPFVRSIAISEILSRTPELLFLNLVTLEHESYCVELTQRGWRICSDRLDCMYGDFHKLDMHVAYYETIYQLLDSLSKQYRERFGEALALKLSELKDQQTQQNSEGNAEERSRIITKTSSSTSASREHSAEACVNPTRRQQPCDECVSTKVKEILEENDRRKQ